MTSYGTPMIEIGREVEEAKKKEGGWALSLSATGEVSSSGEPIVEGWMKVGNDVHEFRTSMKKDGSTLAIEVESSHIIAIDEHSFKLGLIVGSGFDYKAPLADDLFRNRWHFSASAAFQHRDGWELEAKYKHEANGARSGTVTVSYKF